MDRCLGEETPTTLIQSQGTEIPAQLLRRMQQLMGDAADPNLLSSFHQEVFFNTSLAMCEWYCPHFGTM